MEIRDVERNVQIMVINQLYMTLGDPGTVEGY